MPPITLDNQVIFDPNQLRMPKIQRQKTHIMHENTQTPQPQPVTPSNDDAIVISSDEESDYEDSAVVRSSSPQPSIDQLLADTQECGNVCIEEKAEKSPDASDLAARNDHPTLDYTMHGPERRSPSSSSPDDEDCDTTQNSASACSVVVAEPILLPSTPLETSPPVQLARELPDLVALHSQLQLDTAMCPPETDAPNRPVEKISRDITTTYDKTHFSSKCTRHSPGHETAASESAESRNISACKSGDCKDSSQSHPVKARLRRRRTPVRYASCSTTTSGTDSADEDQYRRKRRKTAVHAQKAARDDSYDPPGSNSDNNQDQAPRRPIHNSFHGLSSSNGTEMDEDDGINQAPSESSDYREAIPSFSTARPRRSIRKKTQQSANGNLSQQHSSTASRYGVPSPPHSHISDEESHSYGPTARFEEWPLGQAVLKRVTINGSVTFQLQFTLEPCTHQEPGVSIVSPTATRVPSTITKGKQGSTRSSFTPEEDRLIITLKNRGLSWKDIHAQHKSQFQERAVGCLQVRYSTKLKHQ